MDSIKTNLSRIHSSLPDNVVLIAVSKTKPVTDLMQAYQHGSRNFGENKIQEMTEKWEELPKDIHWHMIGHVQTNKVKYMAPYVDTIHAVDSFKLLKEINKQAAKHDRVINCLLQIKIAEEDSKFGLSAADAIQLLQDHTLDAMHNIKITGLMGMATFTDNEKQLHTEFESIEKLYKSLQEKYPEFKTLSTGMSGDYKIAVEHGSTVVRIGSSIFGERNYG